MTANVIRLGRAAVLATTLLGVPATSQATVLVPGGAVMPDVLTGTAGTLVDSLLTPLTSGGELIANLRTAVVMNAGGTLDFYYQIGNKGTSGHNIDLAFNQSFATGSTFATNVFYRLANGGLDFFHSVLGGVPTTATRSADGTVVGFEFSGSPLRSALRINPGEISSILVIRTNATDYMPGSTTISNSITLTGASFGPDFPPSAVPEPASLLLLGSAFAAAGYVARHRVAKKKPTTV